MKPHEPAARSSPSRSSCFSRHTLVIAAGLLGLLLLLPACATKIATEPALQAGAHAQWARGEQVGPDIGLGISAGKHEVTLALDPLQGVLDLLRGPRTPDASAAVSEAQDLEARLTSAISSELARGEAASADRLAALQEAVTGLREGLREQAGQPAAPLAIDPPPIGGSLVQWILWAVAALVALVAWLRGRKAISGALAAAIAKARDLLAAYDAAPYTAEDVASIDAARAGVPRPTS